MVIIYDDVQEPTAEGPNSASPLTYITPGLTNSHTWCSIHHMYRVHHRTRKGNGQAGSPQFIPLSFSSGDTGSVQRATHGGTGNSRQLFFTAYPSPRQKKNVVDR